MTTEKLEKAKELSLQIEMTSKDIETVRFFKNNASRVKLVWEPTRYDVCQDPIELRGNSSLEDALKYLLSTLEEKHEELVKEFEEL